MWTKSVRAVVVAGLAIAGSAGVLVATAQGASALPVDNVFTSVNPTRLMDTRDGTGVAKGPIQPGASVSLTVADVDDIPSGVTAVVLNVTVDQPEAAGSITVYPTGESTPLASNLNFVKGQIVPNLVIAQVGTDGEVSFANGSTGTVQLIADVSGYFSPGVGSTQGMYTALSPMRVLDTRIGTGGHTGAIKPQSTVTFTISGVPSGVSAVALNVTADAPTGPGFVTAYAADAGLPTASNLNFAAKQTVPNLVIVPVSGHGQVTLYNGSSTGTVQLIADLQGYFIGGDPISTGALGVLEPHRVLDTRTTAAVGPGKSVTVSLAHSGVPISSVSAAVVNVTVTGPTQPGYITAYSGSTRPQVSSLNFSAGETAANLAVIGQLTNDQVTLYNGSPGTVQLIADVNGYVLSGSLDYPGVSTSRYVRNITHGGGDTDLATMANEGKSDASSAFVVLDIGAQLNNETGVQLSATNDALHELTYAELVSDLQSYIDAYKLAGGDGTIAIATNNDGDFDTYTASKRGADWANKVIDVLTAPAGVTLWGADDIESSFTSTELQAQQWETAFVADPKSHNLLYIGSADGCPTTFGVLNATCPYGWTEQQYAQLSGNGSTRIRAMPQIYDSALAVQWANIAATAKTSGFIIGALTESEACMQTTCGFTPFTPTQGWAALYHAMSTVTAAPSLPYVTDLQINAS